MSHPNLHKIIDAFISTRLVFFNVVYSGISRSSLHPLQIVKRAPAGILTGTKKYEHITPAKVNLHWSPVIFLIDFKIVLLTFKTLNGLAPNHITVLLTPYVPGRSLRSVAASLPVVPRLQLRIEGNRAFAVRDHEIRRAI